MCFVWTWEQTVITDVRWYLSLHLRWTSGTGTGLSPASVIPLLLESSSRVFGFLSYFPTFRQIVILSSSRSILLDLEGVPFELQAQGHGVTFSIAVVRTCYCLPGAGTAAGWHRLWRYSAAFRVMLNYRVPSLLPPFNSCSRDLATSLLSVATDLGYSCI